LQEKRFVLSRLHESSHKLLYIKVWQRNQQIYMES
jgi:hypothetical protein